jgi:Xaa-Pro aminopeptidase
MRSRGLSALMITGHENFTYFTGAREIKNWDFSFLPTLVFLSAREDSDPIIVVRQSMLSTIRNFTHIKEIKTYPYYPERSDAIEPIKEVASALKLDGGKVGTELGYGQRLGITFDFLNKIKTALRGTHFADGSDILWSMRKTKSEREIALIKKSCVVTAAARQKCFDQAREGMTELELSRLFKRLLLQEGADEVAFVCVSSGPFRGYYPTAKRLRRGDTIFIDGGARISGYCCDYNRLATMRSPSKTQFNAYDVSRRTSNLVARALKPFVPISEVAKDGLKACEQSGLEMSIFGPKPEESGFGHGQGINIVEPPEISTLDKTVLEPGMVVSTEVGTVTKEGIFVWEDVHAITKDGSELLSRENEELVTIRG